MAVAAASIPLDSNRLEVPRKFIWEHYKHYADYQFEFPEMQLSGALASRLTMLTDAVPIAFSYTAPLIWLS
jgi:hypothetical protein